jgi:hypothetical protein
MLFDVFEGIRNENMPLSFPKLKIMVACFKLDVNTQKPEDLQSLQCHINIGFRDRDESVMGYPRGQTHDARGLFGGGARIQFAPYP